MGFLDLFRQPQQTPRVQSILPAAAVNEIMSGRLPILNTGKIFLNGGEKCHYIDKAIYERKITGKRYVRHTCLEHVGLLVVDEIQNVVAHKQGKTLIAAVTQLINSSGTALCLVGTPDCGDFFTQAFHLARRTVGLEYGPLTYNEFDHLCESLLKYQYTAEFAETTPAIVGKLFEFSNGISFLFPCSIFCC